MKLIFLFTLILAQQIQAATYYVDFNTGSDANNGTTTGTPWKRAPGDTNASGNAASATLSAGDRVRFKGGVEYFGWLSLNWSGSSGNHITYIGNAAGDWGTGSAFISGSNNAVSIFRATSIQSFIKFESLILTNAGGYREDDAVWSTTNAVTSPPNGAGIDFQVTSVGSHDIIITNCIAEEIGQWQNVIPMSGVNSITGAGINLIGVSNVVITGYTGRKMKVGIGVYAYGYTPNVLITNCSMDTYFVWGIDIAPATTSSTLTNWVVADSFIQNYHQYDADTWAGYGESPHTDGIFVRSAAIAGSVWQDVIIERCTFRKEHWGTGGTASIYVSQGPSVTIRSCIFADPHGRQAYIGFDQSGTSTQAVWIYNNTFINTGVTASIDYLNSNPNFVRVMNNVMFCMTAVQNLTAYGNNESEIGTLVSDYNIFSSMYSPLANYYAVKDQGYQTLNQWQTNALFGYDINSTVQSLTFASTNGAKSTWNLRVTSPSVYTLGTNLTALFGTVNDRDGVAFPASGLWPIGAYADAGGSSTTYRGFSFGSGVKLIGPVRLTQ
jgi:hypothetical protein